MLLRTLSVFLVGGYLLVASSANAAVAADFLGSELSQKEFVRAAKKLPNIRLTKEQLVDAFSAGSININGREWKCEITVDDELGKVLTSREFEISYTCDGADSGFEADVFEIDSEGIIRRLVRLQVKDKKDIDVLFTTSLKGHENLNLLIPHYQYSMTFEKFDEATSLNEKKTGGLYQDGMKGFTAVTRLIRNRKERRRCLLNLSKIIRKYTRLNRVSEADCRGK